MKKIIAVLGLLLSSQAHADFVMTQTHCNLYVDYMKALYRQKEAGVLRSDAYRDAAYWATMPDLQPQRIQVFPLMMSAFDFVYSGEDDVTQEQRIRIQSKHCTDYLIGRTLH